MLVLGILSETLLYLEILQYSIFLFFLSLIKNLVSVSFHIKDAINLGISNFCLISTLSSVKTFSNRMLNFIVQCLLLLSHFQTLSYFKDYPIASKVMTPDITFEMFNGLIGLNINRKGILSQNLTLFCVIMYLLTNTAGKV